MAAPFNHYDVAGGSGDNAVFLLRSPDAGGWEPFPRDVRDFVLASSPALREALSAFQFLGPSSRSGSGPAASRAKQRVIEELSGAVSKLLHSHLPPDNPLERWHSPDAFESTTLMGDGNGSELPDESLGIMDDELLRGCRRENGQVVIGKYVLDAFLGNGSVGSVYSGHNGLDRVAVKVFAPTRCSPSEKKKLQHRFAREGVFAKRLRSTNLVQVIDTSRDTASGLLYLVMELIEGVTAGAWRRELPGPAAESDALDICIAATRGLCVIHAANGIHRDIKPDNILIPGMNPSSRVLGMSKLADLGFAMVPDPEQSLTSSNATIGTPGYLPPEQLGGAAAATTASDVFSMAATLYSLLAGHPPFEGANPLARLQATLARRVEPLQRDRPDVSAITTETVTMCLDHDAARRPSTASALLQKLVWSRQRLRE